MSTTKAKTPRAHPQRRDPNTGRWLPKPILMSCRTGKSNLNLNLVAKKPATGRFRPTLRDHRRLSDAIDEAIAQATANKVWIEEALALLKANHRRLNECAKRERELEEWIDDLHAKIDELKGELMLVWNSNMPGSGKSRLAQLCLQQERPLLMDQTEAEAMSVELRKKRKFRAIRNRYANGVEVWFYYNPLGSEPSAAFPINAMPREADHGFSAADAVRSVRAAFDAIAKSLRA